MERLQQPSASKIIAPPTGVVHVYYMQGCYMGAVVFLRGVVLQTAMANMTRWKEQALVRHKYDSSNAQVACNGLWRGY